MTAYSPDGHYDSYRMVDLEARAASASPYELVLILIDGLFDELARLRGHIEHRRYEQKAASLEKCINILSGLSAALDHEQGGKLVEDLARLYDYCIYRLTEVGASLDPKGLDEIELVLRNLREGWEGVDAARRGAR